jgi:cation transport ATPase
VNGVEESELPRLVAAVERESEHPLAEAIIKSATTRGVDTPFGEGIRGRARPRRDRLRRRPARRRRQPEAARPRAIETADVVLMCSDPFDVATAVEIGRGTVRKMRLNLGWAVGYNSLPLPLAAGIFEPVGLMLRPEIAAISMSGSSVIVAVNALALRRLRLERSG